MNRRRQHRYTAWLALLAMLMIFVAPVVSQSLAVARAPAVHEASAHEVASHEATMHEAEGHEATLQEASGHEATGREAGMSAHAHGDPASVPAEHSGHDLGKCGYCPLLTQLPVLQGCSGVAVDVAMLGSEPVPQRRCHHHVIVDSFPDALPRAPPGSGCNKESQTPGVKTRDKSVKYGPSCLP